MIWAVSADLKMVAPSRTTLAKNSFITAEGLALLDIRSLFVDCL